MTLNFIDMHVRMKNRPSTTGELITLDLTDTFEPLATMRCLTSILVRGCGKDTSPVGLWAQRVYAREGVRFLILFF